MVALVLLSAKLFGILRSVLFVIFVNVWAKETRMEKVFKDFNRKAENVKLVTWSSIKQFVLYLYSSLLETKL